MDNNIKNNKNNKDIKNSKSANNKARLAEKILQNRFYPLVFLTIIVFVSVSLVMAVNNITETVIIAQRDAEIISQVKVIFPDMDDYVPRDEYYEIYSGGEVIGYAFIATGQGYGGEITILVGLNTDFTIKGITIIENTETPGLGTKIIENSFTGQFAGLSSGDVSLTKEGGEIDAITGATISSKAVTDAVQKEMEETIPIIKGDLE